MTPGPKPPPEKPQPARDAAPARPARPRTLRKLTDAKLLRAIFAVRVKTGSGGLPGGGG